MAAAAPQSVEVLITRNAINFTYAHMPEPTQFHTCVHTTHIHTKHAHTQKHMHTCRLDSNVPWDPLSLRLFRWQGQLDPAWAPFLVSVRIIVSIVYVCVSQCAAWLLGIHAHVHMCMCV